MSIQVLSERTSFIGSRIPNHIKLLPKHLSTIDKALFRQLVKLILQDLEGKNVTSDMYSSIKDTVDCETCNIDAIYGSLLMLLRCALKSHETPLKQETLREDLCALKIPDDYIEDLVNVAFGPRRLNITDHFLRTVPQFPKLEKLCWRVDVAISTSFLSRALQPVVIMELTLSNGDRKVFEIQPLQFHQLRFSVSTLLKEMKNLEGRNILKY